MKRTMRLTESELINIIQRVIKESKGKNLMEQVDPKLESSLKLIFTQVATIYNNAIKSDPKLKQTQLTVAIIPKEEKGYNLYRWMYGNTELPEWGNLTVTTETVLNQGPSEVGKLILATFDPTTNKKLPEVFKSLGQGDLKRAVSSWVNKFQTPSTASPTSKTGSKN